VGITRPMYFTGNLSHYVSPVVSGRTADQRTQQGGLGGGSEIDGDRQSGAGVSSLYVLYVYHPTAPLLAPHAQSSG
jgi:hypothetical protein